VSNMYLQINDLAKHARLRLGLNSAKDTNRRRDATESVILRKNKRSTGFLSGAPWLVPSPRYFANQLNYCSTVKAWQAAVVVTGALPAAPGSNRSTPSSLEQKLRTPDWLNVTGEAPAV